MAASYAYRAAGSGFHPEKVPGSFLDALIEITAGTTDYSAGGYAFGIAQLNALSGGAYSTIESVEVVNHWNTAAGTSMYVAWYDKVNQKVQAFGMNAAAGAGNPLTEVPNSNAGMNAHTCTLRVRFC